MRDLLLTLFVFGSLPFIIRKPFFGVLMFSWLSYMNPHRLTWSYAYDMPFAAAVALATIVGLVVTRERDRIPVNALMIVWFLWIVWLNVTTLFASDPDLAFGQWNRAIKVQIFSLITLVLVRTKQQLNWFVAVIALSVGFFGIKGGIFVIISKGEFLVWGPPDSFFAGNNGLACALLMVLPLFWYLRSIVPKVWMKYALMACILLCAASILSSYSRGAFLGIAAVCGYLIFKSRARILLGVAVLVVGASLLAFMPEKWHERIQSIENYEQDASAMGRINAWRFAYNVAKDHPFVGGGFGVFNRRMFQLYAPVPEQFHDAHSIYFEVLGEQGFVGLLLFLAIGLLALSKGNKIRRMTRKNPEMLWAFDLASMIQVSLVGYAVAGLFLGLAYFDLYYHMVAVLLILERIVHVQVPKRIIAGRADAMSSSSGASRVAGQIAMPASRRLSENA
jgi:probable O-glycosylation ligase (exosortase A-associated)